MTKSSVVQSLASPVSPRPTLTRFQLLASLLGLSVSLYLLANHTRLAAGFQDSASFCSIGKHFNCDVLNASGYSVVLGLPLAAWGSFFYLMLLTLAFLGRGQKPQTPFYQTVLVFLSSLGLLVDIGLLGIQISLETFCLLCLTSYVATFGVWLASLGRCQPPVFLHAYLKGWTAKKPSFPDLMISTASVLTSVALIALFTKWVTPQKQGPDAPSLERYFKYWSTIQPNAIPDKPEDGSFGNPSARVRIVEFSDYECPHCQRAAFSLHAVLKPYEDQVYFLFKNFPLDNACNPSVQMPMHLNACTMAHLGYCAKQKGKFWEFHDRVFFEWNGKGTPQTLAQIKEVVKPILTGSEVDACLQSEQAIANTRADIDLANQMQISSTPTLFINGKRVAIPLTPENIRTLIELELK